MPSNVSLGPDHFWVATIVAVAADVLLLALLVLRIRASLLPRLGIAVTVTSGVLWGGFGCLLVWAFWDLYYSYFFPDWMRWAVPLSVIPYGLMGLALWWLSVRL